MPFFENASRMVDQLVGGIRQEVAQAASAVRYGGQAKLIVAPDQVLALKREFEGILDEVQTFLFNEGHALKPEPLGADPVSGDVADTVGGNADMAIQCATGYADQLSQVISSLDQQAKQYGLVEDANTDAFRS